MARRLLSTAALVVVMALWGGGIHAAQATTADKRACDSSTPLTECVKVIGAGSFVDSVKGKVSNFGDHNVCGTEHIARNDNPDWRTIPMCVEVGTTSAAIWPVGHDVPDGTTFCGTFISDDGLDNSGTPCVTTPTPPKPTAADSSGCNSQNGLKQCIYIKGSFQFVDYIKGTEYGIPSGQICGYEHLYRNGQNYRQSRLCVPKGGSGYQKWPLSQTYGRGTDFCTRYITDRGTKSGRPCESIG